MNGGSSLTIEGNGRAFLSTGVSVSVGPDGLPVVGGSYDTASLQVVRCLDDYEQPVLV